MSSMVMGSPRVNSQFDRGWDELTKSENQRQRPREALRRVLSLLEILNSNRFGLTQADAWRLTCDITGIPVCQRTIRRDLELLESLNLTTRTPSGAWRLAPRSAALARVAGRVGQ